MKLTLIDLRYEVTLCKECITWATEEKRIFLRQALEARLIGLYYDTGNYQVRKVISPEKEFQTYSRPLLLMGLSC